MPYEVKKSGIYWLVKKKGKGGRILGRHPSKKLALRQLRAIIAKTGNK
jgi:hypothetical protein